MASQPTSQQQENTNPQPHGIPYCSDPDCQYCKDLRAMQESLRLHQTLPKK